MLLFWKWKEIYCGSSFEQFSAIRTVMNENNIKYSYKLKIRNDSPPFRIPARSMFGRVVANSRVATTYYIYVLKADYEEARYLSRDV